MADEGNVGTFEYMIADRVIVFKQTTMSQLMMMQRMVRSVEKQMHTVAEDPEQVGALMSRLNDMAFEAIESRFTDPADLDFVRTEVLRGQVTQEDLMPILSNGVKRVVEPADDADPAPAKRGRKAPAKKAAKAAPRRVAR